MAAAKASKLSELSESITRKIEKMGHPREFAEVIIASLGTEKTLERMDSYLGKNKRLPAEEIADEMLSIKAEFARYREKKIAEYYNSKMNEIINEGLEDTDCESGEPSP